MSLAVETVGLTKYYKGFPALDGLDLSVPEGCIYGFLGPNGAGKTTTLKILTGMTKPSGGEVRSSANRVFRQRKKSCRGRVFAGCPGFYDWMNAHEFLTFCGELFALETKQLKQRVEELLEWSACRQRQKENRRVFARDEATPGYRAGIDNMPKIVFLDEPVSALDPAGRKQVMDIIQGLAGKHTVFFSTHVLADVERVCDRVVIINKGKAVKEGRLDEIKAMGETDRIELAIDEENAELWQSSSPRLRACARHSPTTGEG
jgi:ABC-2 type transport system ATP-binding protein